MTTGVVDLGTFRIGKVFERNFLDCLEDTTANTRSSLQESERLIYIIRTLPHSPVHVAGIQPAALSAGNFATLPGNFEFPSNAVSVELPTCK